MLRLGICFTKSRTDHVIDQTFQILYNQSSDKYFPSMRISRQGAMKMKRIGLVLGIMVTFSLVACKARQVEQTDSGTSFFGGDGCKELTDKGCVDLFGKNYWKSTYRS
jgi:hypothetical protein